MKKAHPKLAIVLLSLLLSGCFNTALVAPDSHKVRVMGQQEWATFHTEYKNWYALFGAIPIWVTDPSEIIRKEGLTEVRVKTEETITDGIISVITLVVTIAPQTVVVDGNKAQSVESLR